MAASSSSSSSSFASHKFPGLRLPTRSPTGSPLRQLRAPSPSRSPRGSPRGVTCAAFAAAPPAAAVEAPPIPTLYDVLGVPAGATERDIKAAYRRLARACHPDVVATERKGASADEFMRVHAAYATLSDPGRRADYDHQMTAEAMLWRRRRGGGGLWPSGKSGAGSASSSFYSSPRSPGGGPSRRTWETDQCW